MRWKRGLILGVVVFLALLIAKGTVFGQEKIIGGVSGQKTTFEPETQWVWGEAVFIDVNSKQIGVNYLDYDTDSEKELVVTVDDKTRYENIKSLAEIKPNDTLSIDYVVNAKGQNIAVDISVEKPESSEYDEEAVATEITPEDIQPTTE